MTGLLLFTVGAVALACWYTWLAERALDADSYDDVTALAEAAGVLKHVHDCGHIEVTRGCGGCDPSAIEFIRDEGGPWVRVDPPEKRLRAALQSWGADA